MIATVMVNIHGRPLQGRGQDPIADPVLAPIGSAEGPPNPPTEQIPGFATAGLRAGQIEPSLGPDPVALGSNGARKIAAPRLRHS